MMKKTLILGSVALFAAGAAQAELNIYGLLDLSYGKSISDDINNLKSDFHSGGDNGSGNGNSTSRVGLKGSMDAGSGYKLNFKLESNGITSDGDIPAPFFQRQAWAGVAGSFGEVRLGRQNSVPFDTTVGFDFNGASNGVSAMGYSGVGPWFRGRQSRQLRYITPDLGGMTAQFAFQPKGNVANAKDVLSGGLNYAAGPIALGASFQTKSASGVKDDFFSVAGSYDFQVAKVMASVADGGKAANGGSGRGFALGVVAPVAGFNIGANVAKNTDSDLKVTAYEVWVNKELLKNLYGYVEAGKAKSSVTNVSGTGYALGAILVF